MHHDFWHERWRMRQIGFHQSSPHPFLERWWSSLERVSGRAGLCAAVRQVAGHDLAGGARAPRRRQRTQPDRRAGIFWRARRAAGVEQHGPFKRHAANAFEILEGDVFDLTPELLGPRRRPRMTVRRSCPCRRNSALLMSESFASLMPAGTKTLLIAFEYPQELKEGPPFSAGTGRDRASFTNGTSTISELERVNIIAESPKFAAQGVSGAIRGRVLPRSRR